MCGCCCQGLLVSQLGIPLRLAELVSWSLLETFRPVYRSKAASTWRSQGAAQNEWETSIATTIGGTIRSQAGQDQHAPQKKSSLNKAPWPNQSEGRSLGWEIALYGSEPNTFPKLMRFQRACGGMRLGMAWNLIVTFPKTNAPHLCHTH